MSFELKFDARHNMQEAPVRQDSRNSGEIRQEDRSFERDILGTEVPDTTLLQTFFDAYIARVIATCTEEGQARDPMGNTVIVGPIPAPTLHLLLNEPDSEGQEGPDGRLFLRGERRDRFSNSAREKKLAKLLNFEQGFWKSDGSSWSATLPSDWLESNGFRALPKGGFECTAEKNGAINTVPEGVLDTPCFGFYHGVQLDLEGETPIKKMTWHVEGKELKISVKFHSRSRS